MADTGRARRLTPTAIIGPEDQTSVASADQVQVVPHVILFIITQADEEA